MLRPGQSGSNLSTSPFATISVGQSPTSATYDPKNGYIYIVNQNSKDISVINGTSVVASVVVGTAPWGATYDEENGYVYVINTATDNVSVINGTRVITSIAIGASPYSIAYDAINELVYVGCAGVGAASVIVINGTKVIATIGGLNNIPGLATFDNRTGLLYQPNWGNLTIINRTTVVATVTVGPDSQNAVYDDRNGYIYVPSGDSASANVSVINGTKAVASISVGSGNSALKAVYDPKNGYVYAPTAQSSVGGNVSIINGTGVIATLHVGLMPISAVYDSENGYVYVSNEYHSGNNNATSNVTILDGVQEIGAVNVGKVPMFGAYDARNHYIYVPNEGSNNVSVIAQDYTVRFAETGLPAGTVWAVDVNGSTEYSTSSSLTFGERDGVYNYSVSSVNALVPVPAVGSISVTGSNLNETIRFVRTYPVNFTETGLPPGTTWWVNVTGELSSRSTAPTLSFNESNGTFSYSLPTVDKTYAAADGSFVVNGSPVSVAVTFSPVTYPINFTEMGLPAGTNWSVTIGGDTVSATVGTIEVSKVNGTYSYRLGVVAGWTTSRTTGSVVVNGTAAILIVPWTEATYIVTIAESGLPAKAEWWINIAGGSSTSSSAITLSFSEPNGTYSFTVGTSNKSYASPGGSFVVNGPGTSLTVKFSLGACSSTLAA